MYNFFPPAHRAALANSLPGSTISTDMFGTTITLPRTFTPCPVLSNHSPSNLIAPGTPFTRLRIAVYRDPHTIFLDKLSVVISVDGACSSNGTPSAHAGLGVYFGPGYRTTSRLISWACKQASGERSMLLCEGWRGLRGCCKTISASAASSLCRTRSMSFRE